MIADGFLERVDRELVFEFFWQFSAFECALKRAGYLKKKAYAEADWEAFGIRLSGRFGGIQDQTFAAALEFLDSAYAQTTGRSGWKAWLGGADSRPRRHKRSLDNSPGEDRSQQFVSWRQVSRWAN